MDIKGGNLKFAVLRALYSRLTSLIRLVVQPISQQNRRYRKGLINFFLGSDALRRNLRARSPKSSVRVILKDGELPNYAHSPSVNTILFPGDYREPLLHLHLLYSQRHELTKEKSSASLQLYFFWKIRAVAVNGWNWNHLYYINRFVLVTTTRDIG